MREKFEIKQNIESIRKAMDIVNAQIEILETEYQSQSIELTGERNDTFDNVALELNNAFEFLNSMLHFELDAID